MFIGDLKKLDFKDETNIKVNVYKYTEFINYK